MTVIEAIELLQKCKPGSQLKINVLARDSEYGDHNHDGLTLCDITEEYKIVILDGMED